MSLLSALPLRVIRRPFSRLQLPAFLRSLRGSFLLFLLLFLLLQCTSIALLTRLVNHTHHNIAASFAMNERQSLLDKVRIALLTASDNSNRAGLFLMQDQQSGSVDSWKSLAASAQASLEEAQTLFSRWHPDEKSDLKQSVDLLFGGLREQLKSLNENQIDAFFMVPMQAYQQQFNDAYNRDIALTQQEGRKANMDMLASLLNSRNVSLVISCLLLTALLIGGFLLLRGVIVPLDTASRQLSRIATGDLSRPLIIGRMQASELKRLSQAIAGMQHGLQHIVGEINTISTTVMNNAAQIARQNGAVRQQNQKQTQQIGQISQRLNTIAGDVEKGTQFTRHATLQVQATDVMAQRCGTMVADVDARMREIVEASKEIAGIITLLEGLSLQTKLLALNAAIESAHAGIYGRSFSVVAREIGLLSQKSSHSTRDIDRLINSTHDHIDTGFTKVQALNSVFSEITLAVTSVVALLQEMQQNALAQSEQINSIAGDIRQLNQQIQHNETLTNSSLTAAETLVGDSQRLAQSVHLFSL
nr:methyl-accepting chemotaxis protein [Pantoea sp. 201603H]